MDHTDTNLEALLRNDPYAEMDLPPSLQSCLDRHRRNLAHLVSSFKSAGISEAEIERSVSIVVASYKAELAQVIPTMVRQKND
jgi:hypothetical protein